MSFTAQKVCKRALRLLSITQSGEAPSHEEAQDALAALNAMLHGWDTDGIELHHVNAAWNDTLPYPPDHEEPIAFNLAMRLAPEYGKATPPEVVAGAQAGYIRLMNYYADPADAQLDDALNPNLNPGRYFL